MSIEGVRVKSLWKGALLLTVAAIITKILSAAYRIPYQNIAGDIGFYVYQQVYPFYAVALILSLYGFPVAISKVISEYRLYQEDTSIRHLIKYVFFWLLGLSISLALLLYFTAPYLARVMGDEQLTFLLQLTALSFLAIPFLSCFRGYFQGMERMGPTAVSQIAEQGIRVIAILVLAYCFIMLGYGPYGAGLGATIGSLIGALIGVLILTFFFFKGESKNEKKIPQARKVSATLVKKIIINSLLFAMSALVLVLFQLVDSLTVLRFLYVYGLEEESGKILKGIYDRGQPLIQLGTIVTTAFALTIVPLIARVLAQKEYKKAKKYSELSLRLTFFIGLSASFGIAIIIEPVNAMLYMNREGSSVLLILAFSILFSSLIVTSSAILQGYDCANVAARNLFFGLFLKIMVNIIFISVYGVMASAFGTVMGLALIAALNLFYIYRRQQANAISKRNGTALFLTVLTMGLSTYLYKFLFENIVMDRMTRTLEAILSLSSVALASLIVLILFVKLELFSRDEVSSIPKLDKLYDKLNKSK